MFEVILHRQDTGARLVVPAETESLYPDLGEDDRIAVGSLEVGTSVILDIGGTWVSCRITGEIYS